MAKFKTVVMTSVFIVFLLCGCESKAEPNVSDDISMTRDVFAMDTFMNMKAYGSNAEKALSEAEKRVYSLENELSVTSESSDIWSINHSQGEAVTICDDTAKLVNKAIEIGDKTNGALDITLYPVLKEWGFTGEEYKIPEQSVLNELLSYVDYSKIDIEGNTIIVPEKAEIDLGAVAKGYTGDEIMKIFKENGVKSAIVSLGGNVQALGSKPDGSDWKVAVRNPFSPDTDMCVITISDKAVITSGNYERFFTDDNGNRYWHILDPADGRPADNGFVSVTVIGDCGLDCDALSTALFVEGYENTKDFLRNNDGYDLILVTDDNIIFYTEGLIESFSNISDMEAEVIKLD